MSASPVSIDQILLRGGLDQVTPTLSVPPGVARQSLNFECATTGGYSRIAGYERFDGSPSPSDAANAGTHRVLSVTSYTNTPAIGNTLTSSGGATGVIAYITGTTLVVAKSAGTWTVGHTVAVGATPIGTLNNVFVPPTDSQQSAIIRNAVADIYRADIEAVPGSGAVRGVVVHNGATYAFRDNSTPTTLDIYKSTSTGWVNVPLYKTVSFTAGGTGVPADGNTLTEGGVTATIKRVVLTSGSWSAGTAAGRLIITAPAGGNFSAGAATAGSVAVTLSGVQTAITLLPGGRFDFDEHNFAGQAVTTRVYGYDGKNPAFEFDGDVLVPILTGATSDTPTSVVCHKNFLFLSVGSSLMHSAPGLPYDFTALSGASEIAVGSTITDTISMPGGSNAATLGVFTRNNTFILYGTGTSDWNLVTYNSGTGTAPLTAQNMSQTYAYDDRGVNSIQASIQFGNFVQASITVQILPFITEHIGQAVYTVLCRNKSQLRVFYSDGYGLFITINNATLMGCMPVYFPDAVSCVWEGKDSTGRDVILFGSTTGMVYQMEKGTSFDGAAIPFYLTTNYSNAKSPRTLKRYRKVIPEISAQDTACAEFDFGYVLGYGSIEYEQDDPLMYSASPGGVKWDNPGIVWDTDIRWDPAVYIAAECYAEGTAENIALLINGSSDYVSPFTINSFLVHYSPRRMMR